MKSVAVLGSHVGLFAVQVAKSLQDPMAAEANGSEAAPTVRPRKSDISNGLECKLSTSTSKVSSFNYDVMCPWVESQMRAIPASMPIY